MSDDILAMMEEGDASPKAIADQFKLTIPEAHSAINDAIRNSPDNRFHRKLKQALSPKDKMLNQLSMAASHLEEGNVEEFFEEISPLIAMKEAEVALTGKDAKIASSTRKDLLDRAGFKPKTKLEITTKYDRMTREESEALLKAKMNKLVEMGVIVVTEPQPQDDEPIQIEEASGHE